MDNIEQQWKEAVEEFGDCAFERFTVRCAPHINKQVPMLSNQDFEDYDKQCMELKPLAELFGHGVSVYGFEAEKQMWEYKSTCGDWQKFPEYSDYNSARNAISRGFYKHRRKTRAALPFDFPRAIAGDVVEWKNEKGNWLVIPQTELYLFHGIEHKLRMKYPPKLNR